MAPPRIRGTWFVAPTAFDEDGRLDLASQRRMIESCIGWGVDGVTLLGVMGEVSTLDEGERRQIVTVCLDAADGVLPVVVGCSAASVGQARRRIREAAELGAAGVMVSAPALHRNLDGLVRFFAESLEGCGVDVIVQDEPAATGVLIPVSVLVRICDETGAGIIKLEDPPTPPKIRSVLRERPELAVFGGLGGVSALSELRSGSCGTMTGFAFPEVLAAILRAHEDGDAARAAEIYDFYLPLIQFEGQQAIGLGIRKEVLVERGVLASNCLRSPAGRIAPADQAELADVLRRVGVDVPRGGVRLVEVAAAGAAAAASSGSVAK